MAKKKEATEEIKTIKEDNEFLDWDLTANNTDEENIKIEGEVMARKGRMLVTKGAIKLVSKIFLEVKNELENTEKDKK